MSRMQRTTVQAVNRDDGYVYIYGPDAVPATMNDWNYQTSIEPSDFRRMTGKTLKPGEIATVDLVLNPRKNARLDKTLYLTDAGNASLFTRRPKMKPQTVQTYVSGVGYIDKLIPQPSGTARPVGDFCVSGFNDGTGFEIEEYTGMVTPVGVRIRSIKKLKIDREAED